MAIPYAQFSTAQGGQRRRRSDRIARDIGDFETIDDPESGNSQIDPSQGFVDFSVLEAPAVNFGEALGIAQGVGLQNKDFFFGNIKDAKDLALQLIDTDVTGIKNAATSLAPFIRDLGRQDLEENKSRATNLDKFNLSRIPGFNTFNRTETGKTNDFNRAEREKSIEASGLDFRGRITKVLNQLSKESEGALTSDFLDNLYTRSAYTRGAGIASAAGINPLSGAARNAQERMDINQRLDLALNAQKLIPSVLTQGQAVLQPPEQQAPTIFGQPTNVPLNLSNVADKIPAVSNISAGAAQQAIGAQATQFQAVMPGQVLQSNLGAQQFNATAAFTTQLAELEAEQGQNFAELNAAQGVLNQNTADEQFAAAQANFNAGLQQQQQSSLITAGTSLLATAGTTLASLPAGTFTGGGGGDFQLENTPSGNFDFGAGNADDGLPTVQDIPIDSGDSGNFDLSQTPSGSLQIGDGSSVTPQDSFDVGDATVDYSLARQNFAAAESFFSGSPTVSGSNDTAQTLSGAFKDISTGFSDRDADSKAVNQTASLLTNWKDLPPSEQILGSGMLTASVLQNKGIIQGQEAVQLRSNVASLATLEDGNASEADRNLATARLSASANSSSNVGNNIQTGASLVQAYAIAKNPNATEEQKLAALAKAGITGARAASILSSVQAGVPLAALSIFQTSAGWNDMTGVQKATAAVKTGAQTVSAINAASSTPNSFLSSILSTQAAPGTVGGSFLPALGVIAGGATGQKQAEGITNIVEGNKVTATQHAAMFPITFGFDLAYEPIRSMTGGGKDGGQAMRDGWRENLAANKFATQREGTYFVNLADGSSYNIGLDGGEKVQNLDGTERHTFDVDWKNKAAVNSIPDAHLYAIATGLDPSSHERFDLFHRTVGQSLSAASSNTNSLEGIRANFRAMMEGQDPATLSRRLETLRLTNRISDQEYGVYIDRVNKIFGTSYSPTDRQKAYSSIVANLQKNKNRSEGENRLLEDLKNKRRLNSNLERLRDRLEIEAA